MNQIIRRHSFSITFLVILLGYFILFAGGNDGIHRLGGFTMGTTYNLQIVDMPSELSAEEVAADIEALLTKLDTGTFSTYASTSELSNFNRHAINVPFGVSTSMIEVLQMAQEIAILTDGAFDVTVGLLVNLWGFGPSIGLPDGEIPDQRQIELVLESVGYQFLLIDESKSEIEKTRDIYVDLSAIAKGYAVDKLAEYFDSAGVENYFLEIGGELKIKGMKPGNVSWVPAIEAPVNSASQIYEIFFSNGEQIAVAGSGDYRTYIEQDGIRYSHEIDPRSGRPVTHNLAAAYVIDQSAARADAMATAYMILGLNRARALAQRQRQAVYFIYKTDDAEFEEYISDEFLNYLEADS